MSKAVLISIKPKWVEKIASGKKTIEVRKTKPNIETPFKCYIYCTYDKTPKMITKPINNDFITKPIHEYYPDAINGKVIGEFICAGIMDGGAYLLPKLSCLTIEELLKYAKGKKLYGWRIFNLKIYDKPKELSEFRKKMKCYQPGNEESIGCWEKCCIWQAEGLCTGKYTKLTRPPQSWCYCEDLGE